MTSPGRAHASRGGVEGAAPGADRDPGRAGRDAKALGRQQGGDASVLGLPGSRFARGLRRVVPLRVRPLEGRQALPPAVGAQPAVFVATDGVMGVVVEVITLLVGAEQVPDRPAGLAELAPAALGEVRRWELNAPMGEALIEMGGDSGQVRHGRSGRSGDGRDHGGGGMRQDGT